MALPNLGETRSTHKHNHLLQTPDTFVRAPFAGLRGGTAIIHIAPAAGAGFTQYTLELETGGVLDRASRQRFIYVLAGSVKADGRTLKTGSYAYFPAGESVPIRATEPSRAAVIEKPFFKVQNADEPKAFFGSEKDVSGQLLGGDPGLEVKTLFPDGAEYDFAVNTMRYEPGASLSAVEVHVMEHGLLMLEGGGIYRLGDCWYPVSAGDFIWMAAYCPQWFGALGKTAAKYLIYKDWNRLS